MKPVPLPPPPVPADLDLHELAEMPLHVIRLRDSDIVTKVSAEAFRAAVLLWCACWHQVPAGSLPSDDASLAELAGYGWDLAVWRAVKNDALRGFVPRSDGRLYHLDIVAVAVVRNRELMRYRRIRRMQTRDEKRQKRFHAALKRPIAGKVPGYAPEPERKTDFTSVRPEGLATGFVADGGVQMIRDPNGDFIPCPWQSIVTLYTVYLPSHPPASDTPWKKLRAEIRQRWREDVRRQSLDWWEGYFRHVRDRCPHLTGTGGTGGFRVSLPELMRPATVRRICEGGAKKTPGR